MALAEAPAQGQLRGTTHREARVGEEAPVGQHHSHPDSGQHDGRPNPQDVHTGGTQA